VNFDAVVQETDDLGASWQNTDVFLNTFIHNLVISGSNLFAARGDGLWRRPLGTTSVPIGEFHSTLRFAIAGPQPFGDRARVTFDLPVAESAVVELFDVSGRSAGERVEGSWAAGTHEIALEARQLSPGVYSARLTAGGMRETLRLVHVR